MKKTLKTVEESDKVFILRADFESVYGTAWLSEYAHTTKKLAESHLKKITKDCNYGGRVKIVSHSIRERKSVRVNRKQRSQ